MVIYRRKFDAKRYWANKPVCTVCKNHKVKNGIICSECKKESMKKTTLENEIELEKTYLAKELPAGIESCPKKEIADIYNFSHRI